MNSFDKPNLLAEYLFYTTSKFILYGFQNILEFDYWPDDNIPSTDKTQVNNVFLYHRFYHTQATEEL